MSSKPPHIPFDCDNPEHRQIVSGGSIASETEERFRSLIESSPDGILVHRHGQFLYANSVALRMYGADSLEQLQTKTVVDLIHPEEREAIRAGQDRMFRYLVHTDLGCREVTQFVGWIPPSRAPFHFHTYEECIFILDGHGVLHLECHASASEFGPGASIYLPEGVVHCLENPGPAPVRLLGVFYPSGSPSAAYEDD